MGIAQPRLRLFHPFSFWTQGTRVDQPRARLQAACDIRYKMWRRSASALAMERLDLDRERILFKFRKTCPGTPHASLANPQKLKNLNGRFFPVQDTGRRLMFAA